MTDTAQRRAMLALLVLSSLIIAISMGLRQSLGLFMRPMTLAVGLSASTFAFSIALQNLVWGFTQPVLGAVGDRYGPVPVLVGTAACFTAGLLVMDLLPTAPGALQAAGFLAGVGLAGTGFGVLIGAVSRATPPENRSRRVVIVAAAGSLGTVVIAPIGQWLIVRFGWQPALMVFAALASSMLVLALPIREPAPALAATGGAVARPHLNLGQALREALTHRGYLFMTLAFFACGFQLVFLTTHLPAYLQICGVAPGVAAGALSLIGLCNAVGTYIFGLLGARYSQRRLLAMIYLLRTLFIALFLLVPVSAASTLLFAAAMGMLWLGVIPLVTGVIARMFGLARFNLLYGIVFLSHQVGSFCGAWAGGLLFDRYGNYDAAWAALIVIGVIAFALQWLMDENPRGHRGVAAGAPA
jgi:predicted MFS family arabinose efflux permease